MSLKNMVDETIKLYAERTAKEVLFVSSLGKFVEEARIKEIILLKQGFEKYSKEELIEACLGSYIRIEEFEKEIKTLETKLKDYEEDHNYIEKIKEIIGYYEVH